MSNLNEFAVAVPTRKGPALVIARASNKGTAIQYARDQLVRSGAIEASRDIRMVSKVVEASTEPLKVGDPHPIKAAAAEALALLSR